MLNDKIQRIDLRKTYEVLYQPKWGVWKKPPFRTEVKADNEEKARAWFSDYYPSAELREITLIK